MAHDRVPQHLIDTYAREGAVLVPGVFRDWTTRMREAHDQLQERLEKVAEAGPGGSGIRAKIGGDDERPPLSYQNNNQGSFGIRNAVFYDDTFHDWLYHSPVASVVGQVIGAKHLRFWWDTSFCKDAQGAAGATRWHTDAGAFSFSGEHLPSVWIAGTDVSEDLAPLLTVAGSHLDTRMFRPTFGRDDVAVLPDNYYERSEIEAVLKNPETDLRTWTCEEGDLIIIHPRTYHASVPMTAQSGRRMAFTSRWLGDDIVWDRREMTFDYPDDPRFRNIEQGAPPPDAEFPIIWRAENQNLAA